MSSGAVCAVGLSTTSCFITPVRPRAGDGLGHPQSALRRLELLDRSAHHAIGASIDDEPPAAVEVASADDAHHLRETEVTFVTQVAFAVGVAAHRHPDGSVINVQLPPLPAVGAHRRQAQMRVPHLAVARQRRRADEAGRVGQPLGEHPDHLLKLKARGSLRAAAAERDDKEIELGVDP